MLKKTRSGALGLALALLVIAFVTLPGAGSAEADTVLGFSDFSSDETPPGDLTATVTFEVSESQLLIDINNTSNYQIAQLYFNTDDTLTALDIENPLVGWNVGGGPDPQAQNADGFGKYNWLIDFGSDVNRLGAGATTSLTLAMTGTTTEATIGSKLSHIPPGEIQALAAMKFEAGLNDDSAFGATNTVVPLPSTCLLLASGLMGLVAIRRRKR